MTKLPTAQFPIVDDFSTCYWIATLIVQIPESEQICEQHSVLVEQPCPSGMQACSLGTQVPRTQGPSQQSALAAQLPPTGMQWEPQRSVPV